MRISNDSLRTACDRLSQGIFNLARMKKCATRRLLLIIYFKWISVQDNNSGWGRKGVRGGGCGRPASGGLSFSITKSVATTATDRTDGRRDVWRAWWGVCGGGGRGTGRRACGRVSLQSRSSLSHNAPPERRRLTGAGARTYWRAAWCAAALAGHRRSTVHEDDAAAVLQTVPRCNKVRKQGYLQQHCSYLC